MATLSVLAALCFVAWNFIAAKMFEARVSAALPIVCASVREQRQTLLSAITAYKAHYGFYPPDAVVNRQPLVVDAVRNPLLYELVGVIYNPTNKMFELGRLEAADAQYIKHFFHCDGFKNCAEHADQVQHFLPAFPTAAWRVAQLHDDPDVFALGFNMPDDEATLEIAEAFDVSSWCYVSSSPTNNPGKFDLWIELRTKHQTITIGNWQTVE